MHAPGHSLRTLLLVAVLGIVGVACGGSDDAGSEQSTASDDVTAVAEDEAAIEPGSEEAARERMQGGGSFVSTPKQEACMKRAGFAPGPPPHGAIAAFEDGAGGRVIVAVDSGTALEVANQAGTAQAPASVDGSYVTVGPEKATSAAVACLEAG